MNQVQWQQQPQQPHTGSFLYNAAGQPVAVTLPPQTSPYESYSSGSSRAIGVTLIIAGVLSIVFNIIGIVLIEVMSYGGHGIWTGIMVSRLYCKYIIHVS